MPDERERILSLMGQLEHSLKKWSEEGSWTLEELDELTAMSEDVHDMRLDLRELLREKESRRKKFNPVLREDAVSAYLRILRSDNVEAGMKKRAETVKMESEEFAQEWVSSLICTCNKSWPCHQHDVLPG